MQVADTIAIALEQVSGVILLENNVKSFYRESKVVNEAVLVIHNLSFRFPICHLHSVHEYLAVYHLI